MNRDIALIVAGIGGLLAYTWLSRPQQGQPIYDSIVDWTANNFDPAFYDDSNVEWIPNNFDPSFYDDPVTNTVIPDNNPMPMPAPNIIGVNLLDRVMGWNESKIPGIYLQTIRNAERAYSLPYNLLARQLWQESRYNPNAVNKVSGARGIAQFMPATAQTFGIDPMEPLQAIDAAAKYMRQLYNSTGSWLLALAAYNWGIGNVKRKGIERAPSETRSYYTQILADIGIPSTSA